jgi:hypothetical protein
VESKTAVFVVVTHPCVTCIDIETCSTLLRSCVVAIYSFVFVDFSKGVLYILCGRSCFLSPAIRKFSLVTVCEEVRLGMKQQLPVCSISCHFECMKSYCFCGSNFHCREIYWRCWCCSSCVHIGVFTLDMLGECSVGCIGFQKRVSHVTTFRQVYVRASDYCCSLNLVFWCTVGACQ